VQSAINTLESDLERRPDERLGPLPERHHQSVTFPNAFTDAPELHPNLFLGSLQLFAWLLIHPAAWGNHITRIDPGLRPDFYLAELSGAQWRSPALRQLLIRGLVVWPLLVCWSGRGYGCPARPEPVEFLGPRPAQSGVWSGPWPSVWPWAWPEG
jgi:hypothetical protein